MKENLWFEKLKLNLNTRKKNGGIEKGNTQVTGTNTEVTPRVLLGSESEEHRVPRAPVD